MACIKAKCGSLPYNQFSVNLGRCLSRLTTASTCHRPPPLAPNDASARLGLNKVSEKTSWLRRYRAYMAKRPKCDCRHFSPKEFWHKTNRNIIMNLSTVLGLHADVVCEFLYTMTMQNFSEVLNPKGHVWNICRVPLCNFETCDYYVGMFDSSGNVRDPYDPKSLMKLLSILQSVLKEEGHETDTGAHMSLFGTHQPPGLRESGPKSIRYNQKTSKMAGIGVGSVARENGLRRRFQVHEKYLLAGLKNNALGPGDCTISSDNTRILVNGFDLSTNACGTDAGNMVHNGANGTGISSTKSYPHKYNVKGREGNTMEKRREVPGNQRSVALKHLMKNVYNELDLDNNFEGLVHGIKQMNLRQGHKSHMMARRLSNEYNRRASREHFYYGAQIPVLYHKPFNTRDSSTWIRRHPGLVRMNDLNNMVSGDVIQRYKRHTIANMMEEARRVTNVSSSYRLGKAE